MSLADVLSVIGISAWFGGHSTDGDADTEMDGAVVSTTVTVV